MEEKKCPCLGSYLDKLTQPAILTHLRCGDLQGAALLKLLLQDGQTLDPSGFYRTLKKMEEAGNIASTWNLAGDRPARVYSITQPGIRCLQNWQHTLTLYRDSIDRLLANMARCDNAPQGENTPES